MQTHFNRSGLGEGAAETEQKNKLFHKYSGYTQFSESSVVLAQFRTSVAIFKIAPKLFVIGSGIIGQPPIGTSS